MWGRSENGVRIFDRKCFSLSGTFFSTTFPSSLLNCWLTLAAYFIASFSASHSCDTTVRRHSRSASSSFLGER